MKVFYSSFQVVSRGQLVAVGKQNSTIFSLTPENSWAPKACIIVYYIEDDGEIINDVLKIPVQLVFKNKVRFKVMSEENFILMRSEKCNISLEKYH